MNDDDRGDGACCHSVIVPVFRRIVNRTAATPTATPLPGRLSGRLQRNWVVDGQIEVGEPEVFCVKPVCCRWMNRMFLGISGFLGG
jgi:hypothetical protein